MKFRAMAQHDRLDQIIPGWSESVDDDIAAFRARNTLRNDPLYVLEVEGRIALRKAAAKAHQSDSTAVATDTGAADTPKRNWFNRKQR